MIQTEKNRISGRPAAAVDESLLADIARGDREAFRALYKQAAGAVYGYALSLLRSREDAEDAMQETFVKIRSAAHLYTPAGKPMAWILTITRNVCMSHFRENARQIALEETGAALREENDEVRGREDRIVLETAMSALTEQERQIVMLHALSGLKHREIGQLMGLPVSTVLSKYSRSMAKLRRQLEEIQ
jgi:RNA polymerase sigma-70 factor (ECF subfamily)